MRKIKGDAADCFIDSQMWYYDEDHENTWNGE